MATTRTRKKAESDEDVQAITNGDGKKGESRISFSVDADTRRKIRIAAAHADMEVGAWISKVLGHFADKAVASDEGE